jgi:hypothetical protein
MRKNVPVTSSFSPIHLAPPSTPLILMLFIADVADFSATRLHRSTSAQCPVSSESTPRSAN